MAKKIIKKGKALLRDIREGLIFDVSPAESTTLIKDSQNSENKNFTKGTALVQDSFSLQNKRSFDGTDDYLKFNISDPLLKSEGTVFENFETLSDWTPSPNNPSQLTDENDDFILGTKALKVTSTSSSNNQQAIKTINKHFSAAEGFISFKVKISSNVNYIVLGFSSETSFATKYMNLQINSTTLWKLKWNQIVKKLSDFSATGGEDWANTMIRMRIRVVSNDANPAYAIFDDMRIGRKNKSVVIFQSDNVNGQSVVTKMKPILDQYDYKGILYVESSKVGIGNALTLAQLQTLYLQGWDIGNHTKTHPNLTSLSDVDAETEIKDCHDFLITNGFFRAARHLAYPEGAVNDDKEVIAEKYCFTGRRTNADINYLPISNYYRLNCYSLQQTTTLAQAKTYVDNCIEKGATILFMLEGLADAAPSSIEWLTSDFEALVEYINDKEKQALCEIMRFSDWYEKNRIATNQEMTIEAFLKPEAWSVLSRIIHQYNSTYSKVPWEIGAVAAGNAFYGAVATENGRQTVETGAVVSADNWYHVVMTYDGANIKIYLNGIYKNQTAQTGCIYSNDNNLLIARRDTVYWKGVLDNIKIYNRALSASEIVNNYRQARKRLGFSVMV